MAQKGPGHEGGLVKEWMEKITTYLIILMTNFGILFLFVGICAQVFCNERLYVFIFGLLCLLPIANGVLHYMFWEKQNSSIILIMSLINLTWIVASIVLLLVYRLWVTNSHFETDIVFQFSLLFYILVAIALAILYYFIIRSLVPLKGEASPNEMKRKSSDEHRTDKKHKTDKN